MFFLVAVILAFVGAFVSGMHIASYSPILQLQFLRHNNPIALGCAVTAGLGSIILMGVMIADARKK